MLGGKTEEAEPGIELEKISAWVVVIRPLGQECEITEVGNQDRPVRAGLWILSRVPTSGGRCVSTGIVGTNLYFKQLTIPAMNLA